MDDKHLLLKKYWGYDTFLANQEEIIDSILNRKDTIALIPTGGGKSLCFQIPALMLPGVCIVISPLIALMTDQVDRLHRLGIAAATINSGTDKQSKQQILQALREEKIKLLYISPEKLQQKNFRTILQSINISFIAIDEAHCISQWGYDFRPEYRKISNIKDFFPEIKFAAFTATANNKTLKDIKTYLDIKNPLTVRGSFLKKNIQFGVIKTGKKLKTLFLLLDGLKGSGIIYLRSRAGTEKLTRILLKHNYNAGFYHAGLDTGKRQKIQSDWLDNKIQIMVSTTAFGMGIDKPDVRMVIHYGLPTSMEEYYQEAGRAGRDRQISDAIIIYSPKDLLLLQEELENFPIFHNIKLTFFNLLKYFDIPRDNLPVTINKNIDDFIHDNSLSQKQTLRVLQELERTGNIYFNKDLTYRHSLIKININHKHIQELATENQDFYYILKAAIHKYEDIFDRAIPFSEKILADILEYNIENLISQLNIMHDKKLIFYENRIDSFTFSILKTQLNINKRELNFRLKRLKHNIKSIKEYLEYKNCRQKNILQYFEEKYNKKCDICDICKGSDKNCYSGEDFTIFKNKLASLNFENGTDITDLLFINGYTERKKNLNMLKRLLKENKLEIKSDRLILKL